MDYLAAPIFAVLLSAIDPVPEPDPTPVSVFVGEIAPTERPEKAFVEQRYTVRPNVIELARNARVLDLELPWSGTPRFRVREFEPEAGFTFNDDGSVTPSDDPAELSY